MKTVAEKIRELKEKEGQIKGMGGAKAVEKQRASGKLTARERLDLFFDPGTFRETDIFVTHRCVNFGMEQVEIPADGVVTGFGKVNGRPVFAFAQDFTSRAGSLGEMHSKKICKVMDLALEGRGALCGVQRLRRRPHPGRRGFACPATARFSIGTPSPAASSPRSPPSWAPPPGARSTLRP